MDFKCCKCKKLFTLERMVTYKGKSNGVCRSCNNKIGLINSKLRIGRLNFEKRLEEYNSIFHDMENTSVFVDYNGTELMCGDNGSIYLISGGVSGNYFIKPRILKTTKSGAGYLAVSLSRKDKKRFEYVHRIIAKAFIGESVLTVNHKDGNKKNNKPENLEYLTISENIRHSIFFLRKPKGVYKDKKSGKFYSQTRILGKYKYLGSYITEKEAKEAYERECGKLL